MDDHHAIDRPDDAIDAAVDEAIAAVGDARAAIRGLIARTWAAESELERLRNAVSRGYLRRRQPAAARLDAL